MMGIGASCKTDSSKGPEPDKKGKRAKHWLPLESNPDLMNKYITALGVSPEFCFHEVYGVEEELLCMVPQPVFAVLMLFPISEASEAHREKEEKEHQSDAPGVYFMKQVIGNACGTIGLCHAIFNAEQAISPDGNKFFGMFLSKSRHMSPEERAVALEENDEIEIAHQEAAGEATSDVHHAVNDNLHFNCFVEVDGVLYELDGRKERPINHGPCTNLLLDAARVARGFMARDPEEIRFNLVALGRVE